jgi:vacuolar-type H+-ATPase subunit F/Vma7
MKIYGICDNIELAIGLKLSGIEVDVITKKAEMINQIKKKSNDKNIGILVINETIYDLAKDEVDTIRKNKKTPLIVVI